MAISAALRLGFRHQTQKYVDVTKPYSKMLLGVRYHKTRRKIQMAVVHRMSELQVQPLLLSWSIITLSLAHQVTNKFFSFKKRAWVMTSLCPLSRYRPLSLITSHTMTSVSWNRESVSMGLALVSAKLLPWDWKDYLRALSHSESKGWFMQVKGAVRLRNVASSQPETLLLFLISQDSSLEQLYQCPTPACSPCCSLSPGLPSSSHSHPLAMGRGHTSNPERFSEVSLPHGASLWNVVLQMWKPHLWAGHQPAPEVVVLQGCNCGPVPIKSHSRFSTQEAEDTDCSILIPNSQVQPIWRGAEATDLLLETLKDKNLQFLGDKTRIMLISDVSESDTYTAERIWSTLLLNFQLSTSATL